MKSSDTSSLWNMLSKELPRLTLNARARFLETLVHRRADILASGMYPLELVLYLLSNLHPPSLHPDTCSECSQHSVAGGPLPKCCFCKLPFCNACLHSTSLVFPESRVLRAQDLPFCCEFCAHVLRNSAGAPMHLLAPSTDLRLLHASMASLPLTAPPVAPMQPTLPVFPPPSPRASKSMRLFSSIPLSPPVDIIPFEPQPYPTPLGNAVWSCVHSLCTADLSQCLIDEHTGLLSLSNIHIKRNTSDGSSEFPSNTVVNGLVFSKRPAYKNMPKHVMNARVMLLDFPLYSPTYENLSSSITEGPLSNITTANHIVSMGPHVIFSLDYVPHEVKNILAGRSVLVIECCSTSLLHRLSVLSGSPVIRSHDQLLATAASSMGTVSAVHVLSKWTWVYMKDSPIVSIFVDESEKSLAREHVRSAIHHVNDCLFLDLFSVPRELVELDGQSGISVLIQKKGEYEVVRFDFYDEADSSLLLFVQRRKERIYFHGTFRIEVKIVGKNDECPGAIRAASWPRFMSVGRVLFTMAKYCVGRSILFDNVLISASHFVPSTVVSPPACISLIEDRQRSQFQTLKTEVMEISKAVFQRVFPVLEDFVKSDKRFAGKVNEWARETARVTEQLMMADQSIDDALWVITALVFELRQHVRKWNRSFYEWNLRRGESQAKLNLSQRKTVDDSQLSITPPDRFHPWDVASPAVNSPAPLRRAKSLTSLDELIALRKKNETVEVQQSEKPSELFEADSQMSTDSPAVVVEGEKPPRERQPFKRWQTSVTLTVDGPYSPATTNSPSPQPALQPQAPAQTPSNVSLIPSDMLVVIPPRSPATVSSPSPAGTATGGVPSPATQPVIPPHARKTVPNQAPGIRGQLVRRSSSLDLRSGYSDAYLLGAGSSTASQIPPLLSPTHDQGSSLLPEQLTSFRILLDLPAIPQPNACVPPGNSNIPVYLDEPCSAIAYALTASQPHSSLIDPSVVKTKQQWTDTRTKTRVDVTIYKPRAFYDLRQKGVVNRERGFVQSILRGTRWVPTGGKSKALFMKSWDDRYVLKGIQKTELASFLESASMYFTHVDKAISEGLPSCLVKIVGIYRVSMSTFNKVSSAYTEMTEKSYIAVMENAFYGRSPSRIYDLKGSVRNRYQRDDRAVQLDENLLEEMKDGRALLVDPLSKALLNMAVWNDTLFLARLHVMDYSLLVGVCAGEYVVGVIDYIRRYTWDKQLETLLKQSGMAGGQRGKIPTVIKPPAYKERFRQAMDAFFIVIPNDVQMPQRVMQLQSLQSQQQLEQLDVTEDDVAAEEFDALLPANS